MRETQVWALSWEDPLEKEMATQYSILAWEIPCTEERGGLQSTGSQRVGHDWATKRALLLLISAIWAEAQDAKCQKMEGTSVPVCRVAFCSLMCVWLGLCTLPSLLTHAQFEPYFHSIPLTELLFNKMGSNLENQMQVPRRGRKAVTTIR